MNAAITGEGCIAGAFGRARAGGRVALITFLTVGYPTPEATLELVPALERAGADLVELGVPFSDPIADGPVIQRAAYQALSRGVTPALCLQMAQDLRAAGLRVPLLLMGYYNPIHSWGPMGYAAACRQAGVDGLIVPDLPLEEAGELGEGCHAEGLALVGLAAPNTPGERLEAIARRSRGFLYLVSRPGTTGASASLPAGLAGYVGRARRVAPLPLALGFGLSNPAQIRQVARLVDGAVVGSAVVERAGHGPAAVEEFVRELRAATALPEGQPR